MYSHLVIQPGQDSNEKLIFQKSEKTAVFEENYQPLYSEVTNFFSHLDLTEHDSNLTGEKDLYREGL